MTNWWTESQSIGRSVLDESLRETPWAAPEGFLDHLRSCSGGLFAGGAEFYVLRLPADAGEHRDDDRGHGGDESQSHGVVAAVADGDASLEQPAIG